MTLLSSVAPVVETPFDAYIAKQSELTAVDRFSRHHANDLGHHQDRYYRDLLPLAKPTVGQQYAFEVDLDACTGCKSCVAACHSLNGLDDDESWRTVTLLRSRPAATPYQQTVTSACHHCVDPACLKGCPVDAYEKDPITGIVSHLDDQCIGCSYCTLACPYDVPVYNEKRGIVRKCDMCKSRLAVGEAPACVQSCPNEAIAISVIDIASVTAKANVKDAVVVTGSPPSSITIPTTIYRSDRMPTVLGAESHSQANSDDLAVERFMRDERPATAHPPLAVMLVLTQLSVGAFVIDQLTRGRVGAASSSSFDAALAVGVGVLAMGASVFHLGRPQYFYRAIIGLKHSWLSREVLAFGLFTALATAYAFVEAVHWPVRSDAVIKVLGIAGAVAGVGGVMCSMMIYAVTRRNSWRLARIGPTFIATSAICGLSLMIWASHVSALFSKTDAHPLSSSSSAGLLALVVVKLAAELSLFRPIRPVPNRHADREEHARVARLLANDLRLVVMKRIVVTLVGLGCVLGLLAPIGSWPSLLLASIALVALTLGEFFERSLFFTTVGRPR